MYPQNQIRLDLSELEKVQELEMIKSKWMESEMKCKKVSVVRFFTAIYAHVANIYSFYLSSTKSLKSMKLPSS